MYQTQVPLSSWLTNLLATSEIYQPAIMCNVDKLTSRFSNFTGPFSFKRRTLLIAYSLNLVAKVESHTKHLANTFNIF